MAWIFKTGMFCSKNKKAAAGNLPGPASGSAPGSASEKISLDGIDIQVTYKKIKNIYLRVLPPDGQVRISAPRRLSRRALLAFATARLDWIKKHRQLLQARPALPEPRYISGESYQVWGQPHILELRPASGRQAVFIENGRLVMLARPQSSPAQRAALLREWYRAQLKQLVPGLLEKCEQIVGRRCAEWRLKNMRSRWGSCNPRRGRIWLSLLLAGKAPRCLEYVIIHELVHLLEKSHNSRFKAYLDEFLPGWQAIKAELDQAAH